MLEIYPQFKVPVDHPLEEGSRIKMWGTIYTVLKVHNLIVTVDKPLEQAVLPQKIYIIKELSWLRRVWNKLRRSM